jgi:hypothetical protein
MQDEPINYPFIVGTYEAVIGSLAYSLISKGIIEHSKYEAVKAYCEDEIVRIRKKEREYSTGTTV